MSRLLNTKTKLKSVAIMVAMSLIMLTSLTLGVSFARVNASTTTFPNNESLISNENFNGSSSQTGKLPTPTSWTAVGTSSTVKSGIVNLEDFNYSFAGLDKTTEASLLPSTPQKTNGRYNLFINSIDGDTYFGYESTSFTLAANSFYEIKVSLTTIKDAHASIVVQGLSKDAEILNINTVPEQPWPTYSIYIATKSFASEKVSLRLYLGDRLNGSEGAVLFNSAQAYRHTEKTFANANKTGNQALLVDLNAGQVAYSPFDNANFNASPEAAGVALPDWTLIEEKSLTEPEEINSRQVITVAASENNDENIQLIKHPNVNGNERLLYLENKVDSYQSIKSKNFIVPAQSFMKISFWAKTNTSKASVELYQDKGTEESTATTITLSSSTGNAASNGWTYYSFYIQGTIKEVEAYIVINLGTSTSETTGYLGIDEFTAQRLSYTDYNSGLALSTTTNKSVSFHATDTATNFLVANGAFNSTTNADYNSTAPYAPAKWTHYSSYNVEDLSLVSGVINTNTALFNAAGLGITNPGLVTGVQSGTSTDDRYNNVLMIKNPYSHNIRQTYTSASSISLSASSYYVIEFYVKTQIGTTDNGGASLRVFSTDAVYYNVVNISTDNKWEKYSLYVATGSSSLALSIELGLENVAGQVFFDNVIAKKSTESVFSNATESLDFTNVVVNLKENNFDIYPRNLNSTQPYSTPLFTNSVKSQGSSSIVSGIVDTSNSAQLAALGLNLAKYNNKNVYMLKSLSPVHSETTSKINYSLAAGAKYKVSVWLKTFGIAGQTPSSEYGAFLSLSNFGDRFTNINTNGEYQEFVFYISVDKSTSTQVSFGLGSAAGLTSGTVFCDSISLSTIESDEYETAVTSLTANQLSLVVETPEEETPDNTIDEKDDDDYDIGAVVWTLVPSLLFAVAVVMAIVGVYLRKIKLPVKRTKVDTRYDRRKNLDINLSDRDKINIRSKLIVDLKGQIRTHEADVNEEKGKLQSFIKELEAEHKQERESKIEFINALVDEKDAKAQLFKDGKSEYKSEKEFVKDISSLEKKIEKEKKLLEQDKQLAKREKENFDIFKSEKEKAIEVINEKINVLQQEIDDLNKSIQKPLPSTKKKTTKKK